jgi:DNA-binding transcriptional ArsR family regulator
MGAMTQKVFETRRRKEPGITRKPKLSRMFQGSAKALDRLFRALASEPRREILRLAARESCAVTQFAAQLKMTQPTVSKHTRILVAAGLLSKTPEGRHRWCRLNPYALELASASIEDVRAEYPSPRCHGAKRTGG